MLYEAGRDEKGTKEFLKSAKLIEYLKDVGESRAKLNNRRILEVVMRRAQLPSPITRSASST